MEPTSASFVVAPAGRVSTPSAVEIDLEIGLSQTGPRCYKQSLQL